MARRRPPPLLSYDYDPRDPVPTIGGCITSGRPIMVGGAFDQREAPEFFGSKPPYRALAARADVLAFQSEPLRQDLEVTGPVRVRLWIASDCPDTDFTAKLVDLYPPNDDYRQGFAMNLSDGLLRVRYRDSWERPALMRPGRRSTRSSSRYFPPAICSARDTVSGWTSQAVIFRASTRTPTPGSRKDARAPSASRATASMSAVGHPSQVILPVIPARA